jgi:hypothetical protein
MKKIFAANWISAARAVAPVSKSVQTAFHPLRPGIASRLVFADAEHGRQPA